MKHYQQRARSKYAHTGLFSPTESSRFSYAFSPEDLRKEVRKSMREVFRPKGNRTQMMVKDIGRYLATTTLVFLLLLTLINIPAYLAQAGFWVEHNLFSEQEVQEEFTHFLQKNDLKTTAKFEKNIDGFFDDIRLGSEGSFQEETIQAISVVPPDNRIVIPAIGKNIPIKSISTRHLLNEDWKALEDEIQEALKEGVVHYPGTADPGDVGNSFITGHSSYYLWDPGRYKDVFALLHNVEVGDEITVFFEQERHNYIVEEKKIVSPEDVDVLKQTEDRRLTLMTCTPIGTNINRLIIIAREVEAGA